MQNSIPQELRRLISNYVFKKNIQNQLLQFLREVDETITKFIALVTLSTEKLKISDAQLLTGRESVSPAG